MRVNASAEATRGAPAMLDKWSWLPKAAKYTAELAQIPKEAKLDFFIPREEPFDAKSDEWGGIDAYGNFVPTDKKSYVVKGGALISKLGSIEKRGKWGDWNFVYADAMHTKKVGWGVSLTEGDVILPRRIFIDPPTDKFVDNSFEIEAFGDDYVLVHLDAAKGHRLCFLKSGQSQIPTAGYIGSTAVVSGKVFERKADGWYRGSVRMSQ